VKAHNTIDLPDKIILEPEQPAEACVIWLHGLGASGADFVPLVPLLELPDTLPVRFLFPHAPRQPVTLNQGWVMPAWYDIYALDGSKGEDEVGLRETEQKVGQWIDAQRQQGIDSRRIILAGFSQGGAITLQCGLRYPEPLGGLIVLSAYLPLASTLLAERHDANLKVPILMLHGSLDEMISIHHLAGLSRDILRDEGYAVDWRTYAVGHELCRQEIIEIGRWLAEQL